MRACQRLRRHLWELGIFKRLIVSPAVYPRFLEIAELARSLCHSWATCLWWVCQLYPHVSHTVTQWSTNKSIQSNACISGHAIFTCNSYHSYHCYTRKLNKDAVFSTTPLSTYRNQLLTHQKASIPHFFSRWDWKTTGIRWTCFGAKVIRTLDYPTVNLNLR